LKGRKGKTGAEAIRDAKSAKNGQKGGVKTIGRYQQKRSCEKDYSAQELLGQAAKEVPLSGQQKGQEKGREDGYLGARRRRVDYQQLEREKD